MDRETEVKWLVACAITSTLIVGILSDFRFRSLEIQLYDKYYGFKPFSVVFWSTFTLYTIKSLYLLVDLLTSRYAVIGLLVAIINPLVALVLLIMMSPVIESFLTFHEMYFTEAYATRLFPVLIIIGIFCFQIVIEIKVLRKLKAFLNNNLSSG